jgi:Putative beta-barrel porin-2, OmpL-like. bbp2
MITEVLVGMSLIMSQASAGGTAQPESSQAPPAGAANSTSTPSQGAAAQTGDNAKQEQNGSEKASEEKEPKSGEGPLHEWLKPKQENGCYFYRLYKIYYDEFFPSPNASAEEEPEKPRRTNPSPWDSPPFPGNEYQGYPLVGVPYDDTAWPLMKALYQANTPLTEAIKDSRIRFYGWVTTSGNWSTNTTHDNNAPASYWVVANHFELDQLIFRLERTLDSVQQDHIDWGFRATALYGMDYRYMAATGWGSDIEYQDHNLLYGWDPTEVYFDVYFPCITQGMILRVGRWIACPDIETQFAPDNYLASHSILFTFDTYTQTGFMFTFLLTPRIMFQIGLNAGDDQAPWAHGAVDDPSGFLGFRWVSESNNDAMYTCVNQLNDARFHRYLENGIPSGHDNYNYVVSTWEHRFNVDIHTKTEAYFMWQMDAELGGSPVIGPFKYSAGGGNNPTLPGASHAYGVLNYSEFAFTRKDYLTIRNEIWEDDRGMRSGFPGLYTSHTIGIAHNFNSLFQVRPEIGYYRNYETPAFDDGTRKGCWIYGFDMTLRF